MNDDLFKANPSQQEAIEHLNGPCLVIAGAGTGKTSVITRRIAHLVINGNINPERILALTFTDKAATEMSERTDTLLPYGQYVSSISTFHSYASNLIQEHGHLLPFERTPTVINEADEISFLRQNVSELPQVKIFKSYSASNDNLSNVIKFINKAKEELLDPQTIISFCEDKIQSTDDEAMIQEYELFIDYAHLYEKVQELYLKNGLLSYADLMYYSYDLLNRYPMIHQKEADHWDHILIDEFQDTNTAQNKIIQKIVNKTNNVFVVGDDDQAIYQFRGANIYNILNFKEAYPNTKIITLVDNFRSGQNILDAAYKLIQNNNPERLESTYNIDKRLISHTDLAGVFTIQEHDYGIFEINNIAEKILAQIKRGVEPRDIAILTRSHSLAKSIEPILKKYDIPYNYSSKIKFFHQKTVRACLAYLRFLAYPQKDYNLFFLLNNEPYEVDSTLLSDLMQKARRINLNLYEIIDQYAQDHNDDLSRYWLFLKSKLDQPQLSSPSALMTEFIKQQGWYDQMILNKEEDKCNMLACLFDSMQNWEKIHPIGTLHQYIDHVDYLVETDQDIDINLGMPDLNAVNLITMHSSKGLEYEIVYLPFLVQTRMPGKNKKGIAFPEELILTKETKETFISEERRLLYVAMTRAKSELYLSYSNHYEDLKTDSMPSVFLTELDSKIVQDKKKKKNESSKEEHIANGKAKLTRVETPNITIKNISRNVAMSPSSLEAFETCPQRYYYKHILRIKTEPTTKASFGTSLHATLKQIFDAKLANRQISLEDAYEACWITGGYDNKNAEKLAYNDGLNALKDYLTGEEVSKTLLLEFSFRYKVSQVHVIEGKIDRVDLIREEDGIKYVRLIDYKTKDKPDERSKAKKILALGIYVLALEQMGYKVEEVELHYVIANEKLTIKVDEKYHNKIEDSLNQLLDELDYSNKDNTFCAKPDNFSCSYCEFKNICPNVFV